MVVSEADGKIRICGDFKYTINPYISNEQYTLPAVDELFQIIQGGKMFPKLYLMTAYLQMVNGGIYK